MEAKSSGKKNKRKKKLESTLFPLIPFPLLYRLSHLFFFYQKRRENVFSLVFLKKEIILLRQPFGKFKNEKKVHVVKCLR